MKRLICMTVLALATAAHAQSGSDATGSGSGSSAPAGSGSGSGSGSATPTPPPPADEPLTGDAAQMRKECVAAMNADASFAQKIIRKAEIQLRDKVDTEQVKKDICTVYDHSEAQKRIATNERHVILAYAAMWLIAAGLVMFLWRRQMALKTEIAQLRRDLEAATKDGK